VSNWLLLKNAVHMSCKRYAIDLHGCLVLPVLIIIVCVERYANFTNVPT